jgi:hypothetical protein
MRIFSGIRSTISGQASVQVLKQAFNQAMDYVYD